MKEYRKEATKAVEREDKKEVKKTPGDRKKEETSVAGRVLS